MNTDNLFPNLTIVNLLNNFHQNEFDISTISNYMLSYQAFLNYFKNISDRKEEIRKDDLIIGINFTYGWMPTIFSFKTNDFEYPLHILNQVHQGAIIGIKEYNALKSLFNKSIVGNRNYCISLTQCNMQYGIAAFVGLRQAVIRSTKHR